MHGPGITATHGGVVKHKADWIGYIQNFNNILIKNLIQIGR